MTNPIIVSSGHTLSGITIATQTSGFVENGGTLEASTIDVRGTLTVSAGGLASGINDDGGTIQNAGLVISNVLSSGPTAPYQLPSYSNQFDLSGSFSSDTLILSGGDEIVDTKAQSIDATVSAGGYQSIEGGIASGTVVSAGGEQFVDGGKASDTVVASGGVQVADGRANATLVESGGLIVQQYGDVGALSVQAGGQAMDLGLETTKGSAGTFAGTIASGGMLVVGRDAASHTVDLTGTTVQSGGTLILLDGFTETGAVVANGAVVISATAALFTTISAIADLQFLDLATAGVLSGVSVGLKQVAQVYSGGHASDITVSGGILTVESGGKAIGTVVSNGTEINSGVARSIVIDSGGQDEVEGGTSVSPLINNGGLQFIEDGGVASGALVIGGTQVASGGGAAIDTRVGRGGVLSVAIGSSLDAVISAGGVETSAEGQVDGTTVMSGGQLNLEALYASVSGGAIEAGGLLVIDPGYFESFNQTFTGTVLASGATEVLLGAASETGLVVASGAVVDRASVAVFSGARLIQFGSAISAITLGSGASEEVFAGGVVISNTVHGFQSIYAGGGAIGTRLVGSAATQYVASGATASATTVVGGAMQTVFGTVSGTVISEGGFQIDFGVASGTVLSGSLQLLSGGRATAFNTIVASGGDQNEQFGCTVTDTTVLSGGFAELAGKGGTGITISSGGRVQVFAHATVSGTTISAGGVLQIAYGSAVNTIVQTGGTIDLAQFLYVAGGTAVLNASDLLTVTEGGNSYTLQLAGNYAGDSFHLAQDSKSGTLITLSAAQQALTTIGQTAELLPTAIAQQQSPAAFTLPPPSTERTSIPEQPFAAIDHIWQQ